jgi:radical SAM-linked protein
MKVQRLRLRYAVFAEAGNLSQREMIEMWEGACREGGVALAYSEGKRPSPQISVAAALPQGMTSACELLDLYLNRMCDPAGVLASLLRHAGCGVRPLAIEEVGLGAPSLQSQLRLAEYSFDLSGIDVAAVRQAVKSTLAARTLPSKYERETKVREYDLRPLILDLWLVEGDGGAKLHALLRAEPERSARADQVAAHLGLPNDAAIARIRLELEEVAAVLRAHRRAGDVGG